jgi:nitrate reductase gamma subunit
MNVIISLAAVVGLFLLGMLGGVAPDVPVLGWIFGVVIPYVAIVIFIGGLISRVVAYANIPVPFRITTTCGQGKSLPWIKQAKLDNPSGTLGVAGRMFFEIVFFRSLLRNTRAQLLEGGRLVYATSLWLWLGGIAFHWAMLLVLIRHLRFVTSPTPICVTWLEELDGFLEVGVPVFFATSFIFILGLGFLLVRRLFNPQMRYMSLLDDYFPLFLLLAIGISGFWLRHVDKTDVVGIKELAVGLVSFGPTVPAGIAPLFYGHLFLVCVLLAYFPFGKLLHAAGAFLSPTRNMANNNRMVRHVNPWDYPVKVHSYEEYEDEWRDKMKAAGVPVDKE